MNETQLLNTMLHYEFNIYKKVYILNFVKNFLSSEF